MTKTYFYQHFKILKFNFILTFLLFLVTFLFSFYYINEFIYIIIQPIFDVHNTNYFILTDPLELVTIQVYTGLMLTLVYCTPIILFQYLYFISFGLYKQNTIRLGIFFIICIGFYYLMQYFFFSTFLEYFWCFFYKQNTYANLSYSYICKFYYEPQLKNYFLLILKIMMVLSIVLLFPIIIFGLFFFQVQSITQIIKGRKYFYLFNIFMINIICPPDLFLQLFLMLGILSFLEFFLFILYIFKN